MGKANACLATNRRLSAWYVRCLRRESVVTTEKLTLKQKEEETPQAPSTRYHLRGGDGSDFSHHRAESTTFGLRMLSVSGGLPGRETVVWRKKPRAPPEPDSAILDDGCHQEKTHPYVTPRLYESN